MITQKTTKMNKKINTKIINNDINKTTTQIERINYLEKETRYYLTLLNKNITCLKYLNNSLLKIVILLKGSKPMNENKLKKCFIILQFLINNYISFELNK